MAEDKIVTLEGKDVLSMRVDSIQLADKNGNPYHRAFYAGKAFNAPVEFYEAMVLGEVARVTIAENPYKVDDPENPGGQLDRIGWAFSGFATYEQITNIEQKQGKLAMGRKMFDVETRKLDIQLMKLEKEALAEVKLDDKAVAAIAEAV